ncbi:hypothetical protein AAFF_G00263080 [Aldrovandia affinis]|uniref:Uncharacterized protein n=1 Tax=Aldrovandia affinis TaxID=143900 RepID=A0AAD7SSN6_9TELE|nr:hypothetical protein AAFF_G00263080 [Aldrovandia affinis]
MRAVQPEIERFGETGHRSLLRERVFVLRSTQPRGKAAASRHVHPALSSTGPGETRRSHHAPSTLSSAPISGVPAPIAPSAAPHRTAFPEPVTASTVSWGRGLLKVSGGVAYTQHVLSFSLPRRGGTVVPARSFLSQMARPPTSPSPLTGFRHGHRGQRAESVTSERERPEPGVRLPRDTPENGSHAPTRSLRHTFPHRRALRQCPIVPQRVASQ